ncbi:MAG: protein kinase [Planctomycetota bacterium]
MSDPSPIPARPTDATIGPSPPNDAPAIPEGVRFGRYVIERAIGRGGMGTVFRAWDSALGRVVALKTLLAPLDGETPSRASDLLRFRREAQSAGRLRHPNVIAVYDVGDEQGTPYFTMELIDGVRLDRWLQGDGRTGAARPSPLDVARVVEKTARALHAAHQEGIVHRDVKPGNILVDPRDEPHLGDFGLAKAVDIAGTGQLTVSGELIGTPAYMSPEQGLGELSKIGPRSDVFSLGSVLYLCLAGQEPFRAQSLPQLVWAIGHEDPMPPSRLTPEAPRELEAICLKAMEKESSHRYAGALEMAEDLARFVSGAPVHARPPSPFRGVSRLIRRHWPWLILAAALAAGGWFGAQALERHGGETERLLGVHERRARAQDLLDSLPKARDVQDAAALKATLPVLAQAIDADPTFAAPCMRRAHAHQKLGDFRKAIADLEEALRRDPGLAEARFRMGFLHANREMEPEEEDRRLAVESYEAARKGAPGTIWASLSEAGLAMLFGEYRAAIETLGPLATSPDRNAEVFLMRAGCRGYRINARGVRRTPVPEPFIDLEAAVADLDETLELDPVNPWAKGARGLARFDLGDLEGARADLTDAYRFQPDVDAAYFAARVAYMQGDFDGAREWAGESIERGGQSGLRRFRAFLDFLRGKYEESRNDLDISIRTSPHEPESYPIRALVRYALGDKEGAASDLATYCEKAPNVLADIRETDAEMSKNAGMVRVLEAQLRDMERILFLPPERKKQLRNVHRLAQGLKWVDKMIHQVVLGVRNSPDSLGLMLDFSRLSEERPELAGATEFLVKGIGMKSGFVLGKDGRLIARLVAEEMLIWRRNLSNSKEYLQRGSAWYRRGEPAKALADLEEAVRRAPSDPEALYGLATLRAVTGDDEGAMDALAKAFAAGWGHPEYTKGDPDFERLRGREEFRRIVGE